MGDRIILHCDLNNFFASVTLLSNVTLKQMPVAVAGSVEARHGIILAKNEVAKSFGVKTAEAIWEAKQKCPDLITLPPDYKKYNEYSIKARQIYEHYTDIIEPFGIDECWLDVTGSVMLFGSGEEIAHKIRRDIKRELDITVSVGVSFNKVFAKLGSDLKKPDAVTVISRENFKEKVWGLEIGALLFAGKSTVTRLNSSGVYTIGDLTLCPDSMLNRLLGKNGVELKRYALGLDSTPVVTPKSTDKPKSVGRTVTPPKDIKTNDEVWKIFLELAEDISSQLKTKNVFAGGITVHTRDTCLSTKETSRSFSGGTNSALILAKKAFSLFCETYTWDLPLRSVGFRAISLRDDTCAVQTDLFGTSEIEEKEELIESSIDKVREKFGADSIRRATVIETKDI